MDLTKISEVTESITIAYNKQQRLKTGASGKTFLVTSDGKKYIMKVIIDKDILDHPNIVKFQEAFVDHKGRFCIIMEYANGGTLLQFIQARTQPLPENQILDWFIQICQALNHIHQKKIVHRNVKTSNIFLNNGNQMILGDFGASRFVDKSLAQSFIGTPNYLSPEIVQNHPYDTKSDIWSLGVLLYELCTFKYPFHGETIHQLFLQILQGKYAPINASYSQNLKTLISQCLVTDQNKRPSVDQILQMPFIKSRIKSQADKKKQLVQKPLTQVVIQNFKYQFQKTKNQNLIQDNIEQKRKLISPNKEQLQKNVNANFIQQPQKIQETQVSPKKQKDIPVQIYLPLQKEPVDLPSLQTTQKNQEVQFTTDNIQLSQEKLEKIKLLLVNSLQFDNFRRCYQLVEQALMNKENLFDSSNEIRILIFGEQSQELRKSFDDWYTLLVLLVQQENKIDIEFQ